MDNNIGKKYLVLRRDGSVPRWPHFVVAAADPAAPAALRAYADAAEKLGMASHYVRQVRALAESFDAYQPKGNPGDADGRRSCEFVDRLIGRAEGT